MRRLSYISVLGKKRLFALGLLGLCAPLCAQWSGVMDYGNDAPARKAAAQATPDEQAADSVALVPPDSVPGPSEVAPPAQEVPPTAVQVQGPFEVQGPTVLAPPPQTGAVVR